MTDLKGSPRLIKHYAWHALVCVVGAGIVVACYLGVVQSLSVSYAQGPVVYTPPTTPPLDQLEYNTRLLMLGHVATSSPWYTAFLQGTTTPVERYASSTGQAAPKKPLWPVWGTAYPRDSRALLPFRRVIAYYGNFYSKQMGVLGEYPKEEVLQKLKATAAEWEAADPATPVLPAIEYIDVTAQAAAGKDGQYRARMSDTQIDKALEYAKEVDGIVILDIQVGLSNLESELPLLVEYFKRPDVHLAIDPEFAMHNGTPPGRVIGTMDAADINYAAEFLAQLVRQYDLPPKILVVHRFTEDMVTNYQHIKPLPEVQMVLQMDGWGSPQRKQNTYNTVINPEPIQFTGFKIFYKNDLKEDPPRLMTPAEVLRLTPSPIFIQYQ